MGDEVERPELRGRLRIERHHPARNAEVAAGEADEDLALPRDRGGDEIFAVLRIGDLAAPELSAGPGIIGEQAAIAGAAKQHSVPEGGAAIGVR